MSSASLANTGRPVSTKSRARDRPIRAGSRTVPPSISGTPETVLHKCHRTVLYCMSKHITKLQSNACQNLSCKYNYLVHIKTWHKATFYSVKTCHSATVYGMSKHVIKLHFTAHCNMSENYTLLHVKTCHKTTLQCMSKHVTKLSFT